MVDLIRCTCLPDRVLKELLLLLGLDQPVLLLFLSGVQEMERFNFASLKVSLIFSVSFT